jgi:uncharacterized protein (DUF4415 family)
MPSTTAVASSFSPNVVVHFKAGGTGWQSRIDATMRKAAGLK